MASDGVSAHLRGLYLSLYVAVAPVMHTGATFMSAVVSGWS
jgi:hypothetical protein